MTEFEKWLAKNHPNANDFTIATYKESWKAALEWAADQIQNDANGYFNILKELGKS